MATARSPKSSRADITLISIPISLLTLVLVSSPLLFGSVYPWSFTIMIAGVFTAFLFYLWPNKQAGPDNKSGLRYQFLPVAVFLFFCIIQLLPISTELFSNLFSARASLWQQAFVITGHPVQAPLSISLYPWGTWIEATKFLAYALAAYLVARLIQDDLRQKRPLRTVRTLAWVITLTGFIAASVAIVQVGTGANAIYGFWTPLHSVTFMGPYVNKNHLAGLLEMCLPMALTLLAMQFIIPTGKTHAIRHQSLIQRRIVIIICLTIVFIVSICGLLLTLSRAGIVISVLTLFTQALAITLVFGKQRQGGLALLIAMVGLLALASATILIDINALSRRFQSLSGLELGNTLRWELLKDSANIFLTYPWLGTGLGSFPMVYTMFKTATAQAVIEHAHQDYLEMLAEMGWIGATAFFAFFFHALGRGINQVWRVRRAPRGLATETLQQGLYALGAATGTLAILLHSAVDFNLRIPANALYFFVIAGILMGLPSIREQADISKPQPVSEPL